MRAYIALGSNLGDRLENLSAALKRLDGLDHTDVHAVSHAYESEPWGVTDQPLFANAVAIVETGMRADDLLVKLKETEVALGRDPGEENGPREIDLDLLLADGEEWDTPELKVPHPRMLERDFVVTPLLDVDPHVKMPDGSPVTRDQVRVGKVVRVLGPVPGFEDRTWGEPPHIGKHVETRTYDPNEPWVSVWDRPGYNPIFTEPTVGGGLQPGAAPNIDSSFAELVLDQLGIPHSWDPFPPERSTDPYGLTRPFKLLVPLSMSEEARKAIDEASKASIDWSDMPE